MSNSDQQLLATMQDIGGLLFRRLKNELDVHEQIALDNWLNQQDPASRQFFEDCSDWDQLQIALQSLYDFDEQAAFADIQKKIQLATKTATPVIELSVQRNRRVLYWSAAAVLILTISTTVIFILNKRKTDIAELPISQRYRNDVSPGGDKAVLELSDGSKVVLDNASNGELAKQGSARVIKLDNGQLAYQVGKAGPGGLDKTASVSYNTISTPLGGQYQVVLPDGSKVWLNASSGLRFPTSFTGNERKVELYGEAYFDIFKNSSSPFKVKVISQPGSNVTQQDPLEIEVMGTEFDLMAYPDEIGQQATLVSGAVKVKAGNEEIILKPNQQANLEKGASSLNLISTLNIEEVTAWKNGLFQFENASIQSIMRQVTRWYDIDVNYAGKVDQQFVGKIPRQVNLSTLLKILESTGWVHFQIDGKKVIVSP